MTFDEIVSDISERLGNLSDTSIGRIERAVNRVYKAVTSSIGLETSRRVNVSADTTEGVAELTFTGVEKLFAVWTTSGSTRHVLAEMTHAQLLNEPEATGDTPSAYAITRMGAGSVTITLNLIPESEFTVYAEGLDRADTLSGGQEPAFPESFHDILIEGVLADEYRKMEKPALAGESRKTYDDRLSDLRYFIHKSRYLDRQQGGPSSHRNPLTPLSVSGGAGNATTAAGSVTFLQSGSGAVSRTVQNKLRDIVSVEDFGATGDGTTDDTAAIQAAIDSRDDGAALSFGPGTFMVGGLTIDHPLIVQGSGIGVTTLKLRTNNAQVLLITTTSNVEVEHLTIHGDGATRTQGTGIQVTDSSNVRIQGVEVRNTYDMGVNITRCSRVWVNDNYIHDTRASGIRLAATTALTANRRIWIQDNTLEAVGTMNSAGHSGIQLHGDATSTHEHVWIERNYIDISGGGKVGIGADKVTYGWIRGNRVIGRPASTGEGIAFTGDHVTVEGNEVNDCGAAGILFFAYTYGYRHVLIANNKCWDNGQGIAAQGIAMVWGIDGLTVEDLIIHGNTCFDAGSGDQLRGLQSYASGGVSVYDWKNVLVFGNNFANNVTEAMDLLLPNEVTQFGNILSDGVTTFSVNSTATFYNSVLPFANDTQALGDASHRWNVYHDVVATASLPSAGASQDGHVLIEDAGAGDRNLIVYAGGQRFRIDGGASF